MATAGPRSRYAAAAYEIYYVCSFEMHLGWYRFFKILSDDQNVGAMYLWFIMEESLSSDLLPGGRDRPSILYKQHDTNQAVISCPSRNMTKI
jgi:hypothetical protein